MTGSESEDHLMKTSVLKADFCVVGGGMSGVCAALAAARNGATVVLIQNRSVLGGNSSSEVRLQMVGADRRRPGARESGILEELRLDDAVRNPQCNPSLWDLLLYEKIKEEPRVTLLLDTECDGCLTEEGSMGRRIVQVKATRNSTEERFEINADLFADCSGDGRLGLEAGADFRVGREARSEFGESLARDQADRETLGSTILFMAQKHARPMPFIAPGWVRRFSREDLRRRHVDSYESGCWWVEWGGHLDTIADNDTIRHELLRIALGLWDYIKNSGEHPDSECWALDWVGSIPGKRESRRFLGPMVMTENDVRSGKVFSDTVAFGGWPIDMHPPRGVDSPDEPPAVQITLPHLYGIPLRALFSRNVANLLFAGRNMSATHVAFASTRVIATCAVMGQAVGTAAAVAIKRSGEERGVRADSVVEGTGLQDVRQTLLKDDAFLPGAVNEDEVDSARQASVCASGHQPGHLPERVQDGITRDLNVEWGPWSDGCSHHWRSDGMPAWIELCWKEPMVVREVHLTFDSGFERPLSPAFTERARSTMIRGPQPETVKNYQIFGDGKLLETVDGNWQRKRVHRFAAVAVKTVRIAVSASNGVPEARIFEIRVY